MRLKSIFYNLDRPFRPLRFLEPQRSLEMEPSRRFQNLREGRLIVIIGLVYLLTASKLYTQTTYVPLNHWVYDYLDRLETKHITFEVL